VNGRPQSATAEIRRRKKRKKKKEETTGKNMMARGKKNDRMKI